MAKIHTHYDNLKVARMAPQEVIRAAYKALSQKYHPDKNPGDDKAARIMAIVNTAYGILSDPMRRKEHDEWIAAEEWEIAWLESTNDDIAKHRVSGVSSASSAWEAPAAAPARPLLRQPAVWMTLTAVFAAGLAAGALFPSAPRVVRMVRAPAPVPAPVPVLPVVAPAAPVAAKTIPDDFAARPEPSSAPSLKTLAVTELAVPARGADCSTEIRTSTAPNGSPWPERSGYIDGYALVNQARTCASRSATPSTTVPCWCASSTSSAPPTCATPISCRTNRSPSTSWWPAVTRCAIKTSTPAESAATVHGRSSRLPRPPEQSNERATLLSFGLIRKNPWRSQRIFQERATLTSTCGHDCAGRVPSLVIA